MKTTEQQHNERKREIMEKCFECYAENGLTGTGIKALLDGPKARQKVQIDVSDLYAPEIYRAWQEVF